MSRYSIYDQLLEQLALGNTVILDHSEPVTGVKSAWYRFSKSPEGQLFAQNKTLRIEVTPEGQEISAVPKVTNFVSFRVKTNG